MPNTEQLFTRWTIWNHNSKMAIYLCPDTMWLFWYRWFKLKVLWWTRYSRMRWNTVECWFAYTKVISPVIFVKVVQHFCPKHCTLQSIPPPQLSFSLIVVQKIKTSSFPSALSQCVHKFFKAHVCISRSSRQQFKLHLSIKQNNSEYHDDNC